ncbi:MAG: sensor histidine kinase [Chloroflexota bacterium]
MESSKSEKLEAISVLAGGISHDFNNLLTAVLGNLALAMRSMHRGDAAYAWLEEAEKAALRTSALTYQLLSFADEGEPVRTPTAVDEIIRDGSHLALGDSKVTIECALPRNLWNVDVDRAQMTRVIHDILVNAREATSSGGTVKIEATNWYARRGNTSGLKKGRYVRISIRDNGRGVTQDNVDRIFDPYFTTKEMSSRKGTGLALAVCHTIVRNHGGSISVESASGRGAVFHICLPASSQAAEQKQSTELRHGLHDDSRIGWAELQRKLDFCSRITKQTGEDIDT